MEVLYQLSYSPEESTTLPPTPTIAIRLTGEFAESVRAGQRASSSRRDARYPPVMTCADVETLEELQELLRRDDQG